MAGCKQSFLLAARTNIGIRMQQQTRAAFLSLLDGRVHDTVDQRAPATGVTSRQTVDFCFGQSKKHYENESTNRGKGSPKGTVGLLCRVVLCFVLLCAVVRYASVLFAGRANRPP